MKPKIFILALALSCIAAAPMASAAEPATACGLQKELTDLASLKANPGPDAAQHVKAELVIRKDILRKIIDCSITDAKTVQSSLRAMPSDDDEIKDLQKQFGVQLDGAVDYYSSQKNKINDLGIKGSQNLSRSIKDWRSSNYSPLAERTFNFIIWIKNQTIFKNAEIRLKQISQTIKTLKLIEDDEVRAAYEEAEASLSEAKRLNEATKQAFKLFDTKNDALDLTKQSLEALSLTYEKFFGVSKAVGKIIPQPK